MKIYPWILICQDEEIRARELSCEGVLLCTSVKDIEYAKLISMIGKCKHTQNDCWECCHILLFNLFHFVLSIPFKLAYKYVLNTIGTYL